MKPAKANASAQVRTSATILTISKQEIAAAKNDLQTTLMDARVEPYVEAGKTAGFRFEDVAKDGIFSKLGFQSGDVLFEFNGKRISDLVSAMNVFSFEWVRNSDRASYRIRRAGVVQSVSVIVK